MNLAEPIDKGAHTCEQGAVITVIDSFADALSHCADQAFRQINARAAGDLAKEAAVIGGDYD